MLNGISPLLSPELVSAMMRMGHGDELVLADAHYPGETFGRRVIRADGLEIADLLDAIMPLFPLDKYVDQPLIMMAPVSGDELDPEVEANYRKSIEKHLPDAPTIARIDRFAFYERTKNSFAVVMTGDTSKYGNIILKKGVVGG